MNSSTPREMIETSALALAVVDAGDGGPGSGALELGSVLESARSYIKDARSKRTRTEYETVRRAIELARCGKQLRTHTRSARGRV